MTNRERPQRSIVWFRNQPYVVDLALCRKALVRRQIEGELTNMTSLAVAAHVSRSTASRSFTGRSLSLAAALRIMKALHLEFGDACQPASDEEVAEWRRRQRPNRESAAGEKEAS